MSSLESMWTASLPLLMYGSARFFHGLREGKLIRNNSQENVPSEPFSILENRLGGEFPVHFLHDRFTHDVIANKLKAVY